MSSVDESTELKGGHPPADKVGGMRVARKEKKNGSESEAVPEQNRSSGDTSSEVRTSDELEEIRQSNNILASSGLAGQTKRDYPEEAVRAYHEKPMPTREKPHPEEARNFKNQTQQKLFQPRKN
ncbi:death-associated protein [Ditylenchus destructor]|nr:death-associated protein [Ditylenchus destructor]